MNMFQVIQPSVLLAPYVRQYWFLRMENVQSAVQRLFAGQAGINPKQFLQIIRFRKLHALLQRHTGMTLAQLADQCGYYDRSHLIKEVRDFSGFTPTQLLEACDPVYSAYHALFRSAFVDMPPGIPDNNQKLI